ncbi:MAG: sigma-70 family RNA polymerase sigma factor [Alphaproteobacteria bacterium]|nr:sigma-70 family RNA polymerase sigma factor [Alphaproteobacteria bacterium]MCB9690538.1 sigma-70 family RNA polymerase sigma factor [Alphaproteobacteria bacterium]
MQALSPCVPSYGSRRHDAEGARVARLLAGEPGAFEALVTELGPTMARVAHRYCGRHGAVEDVVQETWLAVMEGLPRFGGRSSLKTWILRILTNRARTRGRCEQRSVAFASFAPHVDVESLAIPGHWSSPDPWAQTPDVAQASEELGGVLRDAMEVLPERQRRVLELRDVHGEPSDAVCADLGVTEANQRVLLHRARGRVREAVADYVAGER